MGEAIQITGLREFSKALRKADAGTAKALRLAGNDAAGLLLDYARPKVPTRTGRARRSLRARSTRTLVRVSGGGPAVPYYPWLDFGGRASNHKTSRPFYSDGRYLWKALADRRQQFAELLEKRIVEVAESAGMVVQ